MKITKSELREMIRECLREELARPQLEEGIFDKFKKNKPEATQAEEPKKEEPKQEEPKKPGETFTTYTYDEWIQALEYGHKYYGEDGPEAGRIKLRSKAMEIAASKNLCDDVIACMDAWMKHTGSGNFPHKTYAKHLQEGAMNGGYAEGGNTLDTYKRPGGTTQPSKNGYLNRLKNKNPDLVDIMTVKAKDIKPNMMTQHGQVKEVTTKYSWQHNGDAVYIMHTNNYDGFWGQEEDMEVMVDPDNKSKPFTGSWSDILSKGLKEATAERSVVKEEAIEEALDNIFEDMF